MSSCSRNGGPSTYPRLDRTSALRALVPASRRRIVAALLDWPEPVDERALAASLAADERDAPVAEVAESRAADTARATLQHVHLPTLVEANLVTWDRARATVSLTDHPALRDPMTRRLIREHSESSDDVVDALADERRRTALAALGIRSDPTPVTDLAQEVAGREPDRTTAMTDVLVSLRHVHLPKLDDVGLIEHDREAGTVVYHGHPALDGPWFGWNHGGQADSDRSTGSTGDRPNNESE